MSVDWKTGLPPEPWEGEFDKALIELANAELSCYLPDDRVEYADSELDDIKAKIINAGFADVDELIDAYNNLRDRVKEYRYEHGMNDWGE